MEASTPAIGGSFATGAGSTARIYTEGGGISDLTQQSSWSGFFTIGNDISVYGNQTLAENVSIESGESFTIYNAATLTAAESLTITNNGKFNLYGSLNYSGNLLGDGDFESNDLVAYGTVEFPTQNYTGSPLTPAPIISGTASLYGQTFALSTTGWTLNYESNTDIGTATVTMTKGAQTINSSFTIRVNLGDFSVTGGQYGEDYVFTDNILRITSSKELIISQAQQDTPIVDQSLFVNSGVNANLILRDLEITPERGLPALRVELGGAATIVLEGQSILRAPWQYPAIHVPGRATLTFSESSTGRLEAYGPAPAAAIGGRRGETYNSEGDFGTIIINGGTIFARTDGNASAIGGGFAGDQGSIIISGGLVTASGSPDWYETIGGWRADGEKSSVSFSTGENGDAWIDAAGTVAGNLDTSAWEGVIFQGNMGYIYGDTYTPPQDSDVPGNHTLVIEEGQTLDLLNGAVVNNWGAVQRFGSILGRLSILSFQGDMDYDGFITTNDLLEIASTVNYNGLTLDNNVASLADVNLDGRVDFVDLSIARSIAFFNR